MKRSRKQKFIIVIALVIAIAGMSLGFAAFSSSLSISSSATVTPNEDDFSISIYGFKDIDSILSFSSGYEVDFSTLSTTESILLYETAISNDSSEIIISDETAYIDNSNLTISNVKAEFTSNGQFFASAFLIVNNGYYDAYVSFDDESRKYYEGAPGKCIPGDGATEQLVAQACEGIILGTSFTSDITVDGKYKLSPGEYIGLEVDIDYEEGAALADGPFTVEFDPMKFNFSTAAD